MTTGVAYEVRTEIVAEKGSAFIGLDVGLVRKYGTGAGNGRSGAGGGDHPVVQGTLRPGVRRRDPALGNAARTGAETGNYIDGPGAWDGYAAAAVCAAGVQSLETGERVAVDMVDRSSIPGALTR